MSSLMHLQKKKQVQARRITEELDACREEIFGSSDDDDEDPETRRARTESVRSLQEEEERRRMQYEAAARGSQYEHGGGSSGLGQRVCVGRLVKNNPVSVKIQTLRRLNLLHMHLVGQMWWGQQTHLLIENQLQSSPAL